MVSMNGDAFLLAMSIAYEVILRGTGLFDSLSQFSLK